MDWVHYQFKFLDLEEQMLGLSVFEVFILSSLLLSALIKLVPLLKEWGNRTQQIWQIIISLASFFGYIILRVYVSVELAKIIFGLGIQALFLAFNFMQTWRFAKDSVERDLGSLITPAVNFLVVFSEVFLLIYIASTAGIL